MMFNLVILLTVEFSNYQIPNYVKTLIRTDSDSRFKSFIIVTLQYNKADIWENGILENPH